MGQADGKLSKMIIYSFATDKNGRRKGPPRPFPVMYNPESFTKKARTHYHCKSVSGDSGEEQAFDRIVGNKVNFEFLFDATGGSVNSIQGKAAKELGSVDKQIELFLKLTHEREPDEHQSPKLKLVWGSFIFDCVMTSADINYMMFNPSGKPLRAKINASFKGNRPRILQAAFDKLFSADLTKVRVVKAGETLPLIAQREYGDPKYYLQLAELNEITNFRNIEPGTELILPPLDKQPA